MADLSSSKYVGKWRATSVTVFGHTGPLEAENLLLINGDGTAVYTSEDDPKEYTWRETRNGVYLDGKSDMRMIEKDDTLTTRLLGIVTLTFERVK